MREWSAVAGLHCVQAAFIVRLSINPGHMVLIFIFEMAVKKTKQLKDGLLVLAGLAGTSFNHLLYTYEISQTNLMFSNGTVY